MAISPNNIKDYLEEEIDSFEKKIDTLFKEKRYTVISERKYEIIVPGEIINPTMRKDLTDRYIKMGWKGMKFKCSSENNERPGLTRIALWV